MVRILSPGFFDRSAVAVAQSLLGKFLVRRYRGRTGKFMIAEVEAYDGFHDRASHASRGKTKRNAPMFGSPGHWYVYFTYGMHWMLNIVTGPKGYPAAVLIRSVEGIFGPARLTKRLRIDKKLNGAPASRASGLWIEDRGFRRKGSKIYPPKFSKEKFWRVKKSPRIGVSYAGQWAKKPRRFYLEEINLP